MDRLTGTFEAEVAVSDRLVTQMLERFARMEGNILRITSAVRIQQAQRCRVARHCLFLLRTVRRLSKWFHRAVRMKALEGARRKIQRVMVAYSIRLKRLAVLQRQAAAARICECILCFYLRRRAFKVCLELAKKRASATANMMENEATTAAQIKEQQRIRRLTRKKLSRLLWPFYVRYKRRKM